MAAEFEKDPATGRFEKDPDPCRPCGGTCGRMTRPNRAKIEDYPGTVTRETRTHCKTCHQREQRALAAADAEGKAAAELARRERLQTERIAAAHKVRETMAAQRAARAKARIVRRVDMGQSMVRI